MLMVQVVEGQWSACGLALHYNGLCHTHKKHKDKYSISNPVTNTHTCFHSHCYCHYS